MSESDGGEGNTTPYRETGDNAGDEVQNEQGFSRDEEQSRQGAIDDESDSESDSGSDGGKAKPSYEQLAPLYEEIRLIAREGEQVREQIGRPGAEAQEVRQGALRLVTLLDRVKRLLVRPKDEGHSGWDSIVLLVAGLQLGLDGLAKDVCEALRVDPPGEPRFNTEAINFYRRELDKVGDRGIPGDWGIPAEEGMQTATNRSARNAEEELG